MADEKTDMSEHDEAGDPSSPDGDGELDLQEAPDSVEQAGDPSSELESTAVDEPDDDAGDSGLRVVFRLGSRQYSAKLFDWEIGEKIEGVTENLHRVTDVLLATDGEKTVIGKPCIEGAHVEIEIDHDAPAIRTVSFKRRRRKHSSRTTKGHAQRLISFTVVGISVPGFDPEPLDFADSSAEMQT